MQEAVTWVTRVSSGPMITYLHRPAQDRTHHHSSRIQELFVRSFSSWGFRDSYWLLAGGGGVEGTHENPHTFLRSYWQLTGCWEETYYSVMYNDYVAHAWFCKSPLTHDHVSSLNQSHCCPLMVSDHQKVRNSLFGHDALPTCMRSKSAPATMSQSELSSIQCFSSDI